MQKSIYSVISILLGVSIWGGCKAKPTSNLNSEQAFHGTYFGGTAFSCTGILPKPSDNHFLAVAEGDPLLASRGINLSCIDKWADLDFGKPPWEKDHWLAKFSKDQMEREVFAKFPRAFKRTLSGGWSYNQPDCTTPMKNLNVCGMKVKVRIASFVAGNILQKTDGRDIDAVIYDGCPEHHWNNTIKDHPNHPHNNRGLGNPCKRGSRSLDLYESLWASLGLPKDVGAVDIRVRFSDAAGTKPYLAK